MDLLQEYYIIYTKTNSAQLFWSPNNNSDDQRKINITLSKEKEQYHHTNSQNKDIKIGDYSPPPKKKRKKKKKSIWTC